MLPVPNGDCNPAGRLQCFSRRAFAESAPVSLGLGVGARPRGLIIDCAPATADGLTSVAEDERDPERAKLWFSGWLAGLSRCESRFPFCSERERSLRFCSAPA